MAFNSRTSYARFGDVRDKHDTVLEGRKLDEVKSEQSLKRAVATVKRHNNALLKDIHSYWESKSSLDEALLNIIDEEDRVAYPEERIIAYITEYILEGANIHCTDVYGNTPLHEAAWNGFPDLAKELLQQGANIHALNGDGHTPVEIAITKGLEVDNDSTDNYSLVAALLIKGMEPSIVRGLFLASSTESAKLNFRELISNPDMQEATDAVLDSLIERVPDSKKTIKVHYSLLEANEKGDVLSGRERLRSRGSNFRYIVYTENKDVLMHSALTLLIQSKWKRFARKKLILNFFYWAITLILMSLALFLAARSKNPRVYNTPKDYFRAVCEVATFILATISLFRDIVLIYVVRLNFLKEYNYFIFNYFNILTTLLLYIYFVLFATNTNERWEIASIAIALYTLKGIKYLLTIRSIGHYFFVLVKIMRHDILPFLVVFAIVLLATTGCLYLEQRLLAVTNSTTQNPEDEISSDYPKIFLVGIRMMVEGDKIVNYQKYEWIAYGTYLVFMFFVVVVLQSLLIAQMSDTFTNIQVDVVRILILNKARTIINIEETKNSVLFPRINKLWARFFPGVLVLTEEVWTDSERHLMKVELPDSLMTTKRLSRLERMMTTQRELVEELRDSMMAEQRKIMTKMQSLKETQPQEQ